MKNEECRMQNAELKPKPMSMELLPVAASHMPKSWREKIAAARAAGEPETVVQLIAEAASPHKINANGWHLEQARTAVLLLKGLPRSKSRLSRLRGLFRRLYVAEKRDARDQRISTYEAKILDLNRAVTWHDVRSLTGIGKKSHCEGMLNNIRQLERRDMGGIKCWVRKKSTPPPAGK